MANPQLPNDVISDILTLLPTKTLTRFRSVCKPWLSLLSNPTFIKSHLLRSSRSLSNHSLIIHYLSLSHDDVISIFRINSIQYPRTPSIQFPDTLFKMELVGSTCGLVCLTDCSLGFMFVLWNPATRMCKSVPFPRRERGADRVFVGFGFNGETDDFYVISVFKTKNVEKEVVSRCYVYSCGGGVWRELLGEVFPGNLVHMWSVVTVKGVPYWMGFTVGNGDYDESSMGEVCVSFDAERGAFRLYDLPEYEWNGATGACIVNLRDSVAGMMFSPGAVANKLVDVYLLDERKGTWSKMYTVGPIQLDVKRVLQCFIDGEIVVEDGEGKLWLYDPKTENVTIMRMDRARELSYKAFDYIESLVNLEDMEPVKGDDRTEMPSPSQRRSSGDTSRDEFLSRGFKLRL